MTDVRLKILPPWSTFINEIQALFDGDPQIACNVSYESGSPSIVLATNNPDKAATLLKLLPSEKKFGNVTLNIGVDCQTISNKAFTNPKEQFFEDLKNRRMLAQREAMETYDSLDGEADEVKLKEEE